MEKPEFKKVQVGDEIPPLLTGPITRKELAIYCGASGDHNPIHVDIDYAKESGLDDVIAHGMLSMAFLGRLVTNWVSQESVREFKTRFTAMTLVGDTVTCRGKIIEKFNEAGENRIRLELIAENPREQSLIGEAVISLN
jgi:acyl dehydratase